MASAPRIRPGADHREMFPFGYGSNLSVEFVFEKLIPNAKFAMKGYLPNFEVTEQELIALEDMESVHNDRY